MNKNKIFKFLKMLSLLNNFKRIIKMKEIGNTRPIILEEVEIAQNNEKINKFKKLFFLS